MPAETLPALGFGNLSVEDVDTLSLLDDADAARLASAEPTFDELRGHAERLREFGSSRVDTEAPAIDAHVGWRREDGAAREAADCHWREERLDAARRRHEAEDAELVRARRGGSGAQVERDELAAELCEANAEEVTRRGGRAAPRMIARAATLWTRVRLGRARLALGRTAIELLRPRSREHRAGGRRARAASRSSRGDPDPGKPEPPLGGSR